MKIQKYIINIPYPVAYSYKHLTQTIWNVKPIGSNFDDIEHWISFVVEYLEMKSSVKDTYT